MEWAGIGRRVRVKGLGFLLAELLLDACLDGVVDGVIAARQRRASDQHWSPSPGGNKDMNRAGPERGSGHDSRTGFRGKRWSRLTYPQQIIGLQYQESKSLFLIFWFENMSRRKEQRLVVLVVLAVKRNERLLALHVPRLVNGRRSSLCRVGRGSRGIEMRWGLFFLTFLRFPLGWQTSERRGRAQSHKARRSGG